MEILSEPVRKPHKARLSKSRKKKSWRKFSNVADVEEFLDEEREDARTGGPLYEKKDSDLFLIDDVKPDLPPPSRKSSHKSPAAVSQPSEISLWKDLKCFRGITGNRVPEKAKPHGNVSLDVNSKQLKRTVEILNQRKTEKVRRAENKAKKAAAEQEAVNERGADPVFNRNLWASNSDKDKVDQRQAAITKSAGLPPTLRLKKASGFTAVELPHPGSSYNPAETDHADLIAIATAHAAKVAAEDAKLAVFSAKRNRSDKSAAETWMEEMEEGLPNTSTEPTDETVIKRESDEDTDDDVKGAVGKERKTNKIRKREKLQDDKTKKRSELKRKRIRDNEVYSVKKIMKEIKVKEAADSKKALLRKAKIEDPKRVKKLGLVKFVEPEVDVKLKEDIEDNLRRLKPEGSLFVDRYKSLQRRNILEPRKRQRVKRTYKLKKYQIEGRKMDEV
ncbi:hypothetical protein BV898_04621 [Hypsibius exemplaris]|uniref:Ribosome biogenesis protein NOP53 n=1 Tax=Hypsibius exemplaris TaxID=2072580 RepID=A0A1W0X270_HYPEX|nr:hypothetical protein BV898_04621 [Hypsibius exemplaris]